MMTTAEMNMTASQEAQLETAILNVLHRWRLDDNYRLKRLEIEQEYKWRGKPGDIRVIMEIDNGLPGTFGYIFPIHATSLSVGTVEWLPIDEGKRIRKN